MVNNKPTTEELDKGIEEAIQEAEKPEEQIEQVEPNEEKEEPQETSQETPQEVDYKKKFIESTRQAQILASKNKKLSEAIENSSLDKEITEDDVRRKYPEFDDLSDFEKKMARDRVIEDKRLESIRKISEEFKNIDAWQEKVKTFVTDPKMLADNPDLEGKQDEFEVFASKPSRMGADFQDLVAAFLYERSKSVVKHKGKMFETGGGGIKEKPKSDKISLADSQKLRNSNYSLYKEYLIAGKIATE